MHDTIGRKPGMLSIKHSEMLFELLDIEQIKFLLLLSSLSISASLSALSLLFSLFAFERSS